ncbi:MAG TPA: hypothetical protein VFW09_21350 [Solirubrobacteraceae bacterium]|nr:hypothetical protein [Solirubrobacteraceae bacterium]
MRPPSAAAARGAIAGALRWLRSDLSDTVRVVRAPDAAGAGAAGASPAALGPGLDRWSGRLRRRRAVVIARRALLAVLPAALIAAIVIFATGGDRPLWLFAALLVGPLAGLVALARTPSQAQTARALDRGLGLHERLGTALELRAAPTAPTGLGALVVDEASVALGRSLSGARAVGRRGTAEWAWVAALMGALALAMAVPRLDASASTGPGGRAAAAAAGGAGTGPGAHRRAAIGKATLPARLPPIARHRTPPPVGLDSGARGRSVNPYGNGYKGGHLQGKAQTHFSGNRQAGLNLAGPGGPGGADNGGAAGGAGRGSASAGGAGGGASSRRLTAGQGGLPQAANGQSQSGARRAAGLGARAGGGAPPGGESAGATRGVDGHGSGVVPVLGARSSGLPLQAGFAPVHGHHGAARGGVSPQANGGGGRGRTATVGAGAGSGGATGRFPVIPPTFNVPSPEAELLQNYFGGSNQLLFKAW